MIGRFHQIARESIEARKGLFDSHAETVARATELIITSVKADGKMLIFGNGTVRRPMPSGAPNPGNQRTRGPNTD